MPSISFKTDKHQQLCWDCANNSGKCSWSRNFTPIKGWKATPTKIKTKEAPTGEIDSFDIYECPEYKNMRR